MTTQVWQGQAPAVAQISEAICTGVQNGETYKLVVNGETINSYTAGGTTSALQLVQALASGWQAATGNPYSRPITCTGLATGGNNILRWTADIAGNPFTVSTAVTGPTGGGFSAVTTPTANAGPNDWNTAANWSGGAVPIAADDVVFRDGSVPVLWGLAQSAVTLASLAIEQSYTGAIGLNKRAVVTGAAGLTATGKPEYREDYLDIGWDEARIGEIIGTGSPAGAGRLKLDNAKAGSSTTTVHNTASAGLDSNQPAVRLLFANAGADVLVRNGAGGVGIAIDDAGETATVGDVSVSDKTAASQVFLGEGVTLDTFTQDGGINVLRAAAGVTGITVNGGTLNIEGSGYAITALTVNGGTVYPNSTPTGGNAITTVNIDGGTVDATQSREARTWGTVNLKRAGSTLRADNNVVTITTLSEPDNQYGLQVV